MIVAGPSASSLFTFSAGTEPGLGNLVGPSVAVDGHTIAVGFPYDATPAGVFGGVVRVFVRTNGERGIDPRPTCDTRTRRVEMSQETCRAIMSTYLEEVLGQRRFDLIPGIAADDLIDHTQPHLRGSEALVAHARGFCDNTPDLRIEVLRIIATDDTALGIWRWHGDPARPSGVSNSGAPVVPRLIASLFDISNGKITEYRAFVDAVDVFTQLAR